MWELIEENIKDQGTYTYIVSHRLKVPNGWIVRTVTSRYHGGAHSEHTFVADSSHSWQLQKAS